MGTEDAVFRITLELRRALDHMSSDLDRIEMLSAALDGFSRPVPDYEPAFHHLGPATLLRHEIRGDG